MMKHYLSLAENAIRNYWNLTALTNYRKNSYSYEEVAIQIEKIHLIFETTGIQKNDKVVLCARNSAEWCIAFLGITTYGAIAVPLLNDFLPDSIERLTNHSDSTAIFTENEMWNELNIEKLPHIKVALNIQDLHPLHLNHAPENCICDLERTISELYTERFPQGLHPQDVHYPAKDIDELNIINYTSGTTSEPKGVMLSGRNLSSNINFAIEHMPNKPGMTILSMLPLGHLYGFAFEFIYPFVTGCHIYLLGKTPTPSILIKALKEVKPYLLITVPLVIEKIFKGKILPRLNKPSMRVLTNVPGIREIIYTKIRKKLLSIFGGQLNEGLIIGGAAINEKVEQILHKIKFPYTIGYGMTECAPLIGYEKWCNFIPRSCGKKVDRIDIRIDSDNPQETVGEIQIKGENVMLGYYKNPEATKDSFTSDGWLKTGDLGIIDAQGNIFIKGRSKNMILGSNGQNIYPEELEDKLNSFPLISESVVVSRQKQIVAIVVPDMDAFKKMEDNTLSIEEIIYGYQKMINTELPLYCRINKIELRTEPFEKTPKRSIKRFLYS